jgi:hypothetical protein
MSFYGAAGAVGFVAGLILGGLLTASLGWVSFICRAGDRIVAESLWTA